MDAPLTPCAPLLRNVAPVVEMICPKVLSLRTMHFDFGPAQFKLTRYRRPSAVRV